MYFSRKCKITFISHGATIYSEEGRFTDSLSYPPLNDAGQDEIEKITEYLRLRGIKNDRIYTSPTTRCVQSAQIITKLYKKNYEVIPELTPRKCGAFNGLTYEQIEERYPIEFRRLIDNPDIPTPADAESLTDFVKRISAVIDKIVDENISNRIIIVTNPEIIKAAICHALDVSASTVPKILIKTGSATQISYFEDWKSLIYSDYTPLYQ